MACKIAPVGVSREQAYEIANHPTFVEKEVMVVEGYGTLYDWSAVSDIPLVGRVYIRVWRVL